MKKRVIYVCIATTLLVIAALLVILNHALGIDFPCPFKHYFGIDCPGCGATRMIFALMHMDLYQAFRYNVVIFCTAPFLLVLYIHECIFYIKTDTLSDMAVKIMEAYAIVLIIFGICRNLETFVWLKPTIV